MQYTNEICVLRCSTYMCDGTGTPHPRTMFAVLGIGTFGAQKFIISAHQKVTESRVARTTMEGRWTEYICVSSFEQTHAANTLSRIVKTYHGFRPKLLQQGIKNCARDPHDSHLTITF